MTNIECTQIWENYKLYRSREYNIDCRWDWLGNILDTTYNFYQWCSGDNYWHSIVCFSEWSPQYRTNIQGNLQNIYHTHYISHLLVSTYHSHSSTTLNIECISAARSYTRCILWDFSNKIHYHQDGTILYIWCISLSLVPHSSHRIWHRIHQLLGWNPVHTYHIFEFGCSLLHNSICWGNID